MTLDKVFHALTIERTIDRLHMMYFFCLSVNISLIWSLILLDVNYVQTILGLLISLYLGLIAAYLDRYSYIYKELLQITVQNTSSEVFNLNIGVVERRNKSIWQCYINKKTIFSFSVPTIFAVLYLSYTLIFR